MHIILNFLTASVPLTKTYRLVGAALEVEPYPQIKNFTSDTVFVHSIDELADALSTFAARGACLLKGMLDRSLKNESRAGHAKPSTPTRLFVHDLDGHNAPSAEDYLKSVGLGDVDYVVQYSASHGITDSRLRCHIFQFLAEPAAPALLKAFAITRNLEVPALREALGLSTTSCALQYVLDITGNQNDKMIYIAPPVLGPGVYPSLEGERIVLCSRRLRAIPAHRIKAFERRELEERVHHMINKLRRKAGLPERKFLYRREGPVRYLANPGEAVVTGVKRARGFVYLNLNGGDSWAYFHPEDNPEYIYNFKGEPVYRTEEIAPEYYRAKLTP